LDADTARPVSGPMKLILPLWAFSPRFNPSLAWACTAEGLKTENVIVKMAMTEIVNCMDFLLLSMVASSGLLEKTVFAHRENPGFHYKVFVLKVNEVTRNYRNPNVLKLRLLQ
jgi:hypothetical protein